MSGFDYAKAKALLEEMRDDPDVRGQVGAARDSHPALLPMATDIAAAIGCALRCDAASSAALMVAAAVIGGAAAAVPDNLEPGARDAAEAMGDLLAHIVKWATLDAFEQFAKTQLEEQADAASRH